jgi:hypothetical protein
MKIEIKTEGDRIVAYFVEGDANPVPVFMSSINKFLVIADPVAFDKWKLLLAEHIARAIIKADPQAKVTAEEQPAQPSIAVPDQKLIVPRSH